MNELHDLTDDELDNLRVEILTEKERRKNLTAIPEQIESLKAQYAAAGGNPADLDKE